MPVTEDDSRTLLRGVVPAFDPFYEEEVSRSTRRVLANPHSRLAKHSAARGVAVHPAGAGARYSGGPIYRRDEGRGIRRGTPD